MVEPALNPNHPNHNIKTPRAASGKLWPLISCGTLSIYLPTLGQTYKAPARAAHPPTECTTVEPAKSIK